MSEAPRPADPPAPEAVLVGMETRWCPRPAIMHWTEPSEIENAAARSSEQELRKHLIEARAVDVMVVVGLGRRFPFGLPRTDNGNHLWIQLFYSALNPKGRAGFVMASPQRTERSAPNHPIIVNEKHAGRLELDSGWENVWRA